MNLEQLLRAATRLSDGEVVALWARFRDEGDRVAFGRLVAWLREPISRTLRWMLRCDWLAEDVFQDVLVRLLRDQARGKIPKCENPRAWVWRVAMNAANEWRRSGQRREAREKKREGDSVMDDQTEQVIDRIGVREALDQLDERDREIISLLYFDGLTQQDIA